MKKIISILAVLSLISCPIPSFAQTNNEEIIKEYTPKLQIEYVIEKSKNHAKSQGIKIDDCFIETIKYDSSKKEWNIFFMRKMPRPGNHFSITIKDRTEEIMLMLGE